MTNYHDDVTISTAQSTPPPAPNAPIQQANVLQACDRTTKCLLCPFGRGSQGAHRDLYIINVYSITLALTWLSVPPPSIRSGPTITAKRQSCKKWTTDDEDLGQNDERVANWQCDTGAHSAQSSSLTSIRAAANLTGSGSRGLYPLTG